MSNKFKNQTLCFWITTGCSIFFSLFFLFLNIASIVVNNGIDHQTLTILLGISFSLILLGVILSALFYFWTQWDWIPTGFKIGFITWLGASILFSLIGGIIYLTTSSPIAMGFGMWFMLIFSFSIVAESFSTMIYYLYYKHRDNPNFEQVLRDPEE